MKRTTAALNRNDAAFQERIADQWRDWVAYLRAQQTLLVAQRTAPIERSTAATFELDDDASAAARAHKTLAAIPPARRTVFDAEREQARQEDQRGLDPRSLSSAHDPLDLEQQVLARLLREALGEAPENGQPLGRGLVPLGDDQVYSVDIAALEAAPVAAAYALGGSAAADWRRRLQLALLLTAVCSLALLLWWFWPQSRAMGHHALALTVNGAALESWPLSAVQVEHGSTMTTLPLTRTLTSDWPAQPTPQTAYVRRGSVWPLALCLPAEQFATADALILPGDGVHPARRYVLHTTAPAPLDLVLTPCAPTDDARSQMRYGVLREARPLTVEALNEPTLIATESTTVTITVRSFTATGRSTDPTLPPTQMQVTVVVSALATLDWPRLAPTLWLPDGTAALPSETAATGPDQWALHYLVPDQTAPLDVAWTVAPFSGAPLRRWRATVAPPPTRDAVLRRTLLLVGASLTTGTETDATTLVLQLIVRNQGTVPLRLTSDDLQLWVGTTKAAAPDVAALHAPLGPGQERTLPVPLPSGGGEAVIVAIGPQRVQVRPSDAGERR